MVNVCDCVKVSRGLAGFRMGRTLCCRQEEGYEELEPESVPLLRVWYPQTHRVDHKNCPRSKNQHKQGEQ